MIFETIRRRMAEKAHRRRLAREAQRAGYAERIRDDEAKMQERPCPFIGGPCSEMCIHFAHGRVHTEVRHIGCSTIEWLTMVKPKCRLWA